MRRNFARGVMAMMVLVAALTAVPAMAATKRYGTRTLRMGMQGKDVKTMQKYLTKVGLKPTADGEFGSGTKKKAKRFEKRYHQTVNGVLSKKEQRVLKQSALGTSTDAASPDPEPTTPTTSTSRARRPRSTPTARPPRRPTRPPAVKASSPPATRSPRRPTSTAAATASGRTRGYDCSGSVSYALHGGACSSSSMASGGFENWGEPGRGSWITIYANGGHVYMTVAGLRFDTSGQVAPRHPLAGRPSARAPATSSGTPPRALLPSTWGVRSRGPLALSTARRRLRVRRGERAAAKTATPRTVRSAPPRKRRSRG